jgi:kumamolisin
VYFAPNTVDGFLNAVAQALYECTVVSCSWGQSELQWDKSMMEAFERAIGIARGKGVPFFAAAGDNGSSDSESVSSVDFPASSPSAIGCGGTRLILSGNVRFSETVWNDNPTSSATGGGVSSAFPGRQVPDVAGNADPATGYKVSVNGQPAVIGGTSLVAPLYAGLFALLWEVNQDKPFDMMNLIATNPQSCYDVTVGDNGAFRAGPGRDDVTGMGVVDGMKLDGALNSGIAPPVPPAKPPVPLPPAPKPVPVPPIPAPTTNCNATLQKIVGYIEGLMSK